MATLQIGEAIPLAPGTHHLSAVRAVCLPGSSSLLPNGNAWERRDAGKACAEATTLVRGH